MSRRGWRERALVAVAALSAGAGVLALPGVAAAQQAGDACTASGWQGVGPFTVYPGSSAVLPGSNPPVWSLAVDRGKDLAVVGLDLTPDGVTTVYSGRPQSLQWTASDVTGVAVPGIAIRGGPGREVWAGGIGEQGAAFESFDGGLSFSAVNTDATLNQAYSMSMASDQDGVVAAATRNKPTLPSVLRWSAGRWDPYGDMTNINSGAWRLLWDVAVGPDGRGWLAVDGRGLWRLDRPTDPWINVGDDSLKQSTVASILVDPRNGNRLFVGLGPPLEGSSSQRGLRESIDSGESWGLSSLTDEIAVPAIALTADGERLIASGWSTGLWQSVDDGANWRRIPGPPSPYVRRLATVVPQGQTSANCELLFAGTYSGLFVRNIARAVDYSIYLPLTGSEVYVRQ